MFRPYAAATRLLGREHYQRGERGRQGYRNGYEPKRLVTGQAPIEVRRMYVRGLSQQDVADAFTEAFDEQVMSKSTVSRVARAI